jgi:predicted lactoylglutathione lyase
MIGYVMVGANDLEKSAAFYDAVLGVMGAKRGMSSDRMIGFSGPNRGPMFAVCKPANDGPASFGNGTMIALTAASQDQVHEVHAKALASGGTDEGAPGPRGESFYGAYFRDLDGNKICIFKM